MLTVIMISYLSLQRVYPGNIKKLNNHQLLSVSGLGILTDGHINEIYPGYQLIIQ